jgi:hypothetical protein
VSGPLAGGGSSHVSSLLSVFYSKIGRPEGLLSHYRFSSVTVHREQTLLVGAFLGGDMVGGENPFYSLFLEN